MKKKTAKTILIIIILIIAVSFLFYFFFTNSEQKNKIKKTAKNLFPFGKVVPSERPPVIGEELNVVIPMEEIVVVEKDFPRLRQISQFPTSAFEPFTVEREVEVAIIDVDEETGQGIKKVETRIIKDNYIRYSRIEDSSVFETLVTKDSLEQSFLVDEYIPNTEDADFSDDGKHIIFRYWNGIDNIIESYSAYVKKYIPEKGSDILLEIEPCQYLFPQDKPRPGDSYSKIKDIHIFLNGLVPQTKISESGVNSPGKETDTFTEQTDIAVKNFQSLYRLKIDGLVGPITGPKMKEVCDEIQKEKAIEVQKEEQKKQNEEFAEEEIEYQFFGSYLPQGISTFSIHPTKNKAFYIFEVNQGVVGAVVDLDNGERTQIFESPFTEWITRWINDDVITLTTKASTFAEGYLFALNPNTKQITKLINNYNGLTTNINQNIENILISTSNNSSLDLYLFTIKNNTIKNLGLKTFPEKCIWSNDNINIYCGVPSILSNREYPDTWYQGLEIFSDGLWKINTKTKTKTLLDAITEVVPKGIDIYQIKIDKEENYLYFTNKRDETLWSYRLTD